MFISKIEKEVNVVGYLAERSAILSISFKLLDTKRLTRRAQLHMITPELVKVIPELGAEVPASEPPGAGAIMPENCSAYMLGTTSQKEEHFSHLSDRKCTTTDIGSVHLENTSHFSVSANYLWNSPSIKKNDFWMCRVT